MITGCRKFDNLFVVEGRGRRPGWPGALCQWYLVLGQNWPWSDPSLFPKLERFLRVYSFFPVYSSLGDSLIFTTFKCYFYYYSLQEMESTSYRLVSRSPKSANRSERSEKYRRIDMSSKQKHYARYKFNSDFSYYFFFFSTLRVEKEGRLQTSSVTTKRRNFVLRVNTDEPLSHRRPFVALLHFSFAFHTSSSFHTRSRPFPIYLPIYYSLLAAVSLRMHLSRILVHG